MPLLVLWGDVMWIFPTLGSHFQHVPLDWGVGWGGVGGLSCIRHYLAAGPFSFIYYNRASALNTKHINVLEKTLEGLLPLSRQRRGTFLEGRCRHFAMPWLACRRLAWMQPTEGCVPFSPTWRKQWEPKRSAYLTEDLGRTPTCIRGYDSTGDISTVQKDILIKIPMLAAELDTQQLPT